MGITRPGAVSVTIGTSGVVFAATDRPALDPEGRLHTFCHAIPGRWHVMGVTQAAGLSLRWFRDLLGRRRSCVRSSSPTEAAAVPAGCRRCAVGAVPDGRTHAASGSERRAPRSSASPASHGRGHVVRADPGRRRVQPARHVHDFRRDGRAGRAASASAAAARDRRSGDRFRPTCTATRSKPSPPKKAPRTARRCCRCRRRRLADGRRSLRCGGPRRRDRHGTRPDIATHDARAVRRIPPALSGAARAACESGCSSECRRLHD